MKCCLVFARRATSTRNWVVVVLQIALLLFYTSVGYANPLAPTVVAGSATIHQHGADTLHIHQATNRAIIDWQGFSIDSGEVTQFIQGGSNSAILNRVTGANPSALLGTLQANGRVFLINPNGILVGQGAQINVGSLVASTLDIGNAEFMRGGDVTFRGDSTAGVVNYGQIRAVAGDIYLIGAHVENHGLLQASHGTVGLAAGQEVRLVDSGHQHLVVAPNANSLGGTGVTNTGTIEAVQAELATNGGNVYALAINNTGTLRANGSVTSNGRILLTAPGGVIAGSGDLIAKNADGTGGDVHVLGDEIRLVGATIDASGAQGGGVVLIGGDYQGGNPAIANARAVFIDDQSTINADAIENGNGGRVIIWSDGSTRFAGNISARGGALGGDGGFVEVSGKQSLTLLGSVSTSAPAGLTGTLLLDPTEFDVNAGAGAAMGNSIGADTLTGAGFLGSNNVVIATAAGAGSGEVRINAAVLWGNANSLAVLAHGHIRVDASIQNDGSGSVSLVAGWDGAAQAPAGLPGAIAPAAFDFSLLSAGQFGNAGGSVFIGDGGQTTGIAVGSRFGPTGVAGYDLTLQGSNAMDDGFAQLGFRIDTNIDADGPIVAFLLNDVNLTAGANSGSYAQVGHGGDIELATQGDLAGTIFVGAGNDVILTAGMGGMAHIGHGGANGGGFQGTMSGDIFVIAGRNLEMAGVDHFTLAQIGHGGPLGDAGRGDFFGDIVVAWDQADPLADGGGRLFMNEHSEIIAENPSSQTQLPNDIRLIGTRRLGNVIEDGAGIGNIPFDSSFQPMDFSSDGWNENTEFVSWAHEQWGPFSNQYTLASPGPYVGPFTFFYLGEDELTLPSIICPPYDCFERYELAAYTFNQMWAQGVYEMIYGPTNERPMGEMAGGSSGN